MSQTVEHLPCGTMFRLATEHHPVFSREDVLMTTELEIPDSPSRRFERPGWILCICLSHGRFFGWARAVWPDAPVAEIISGFSI